MSKQVGKVGVLLIAILAGCLALSGCSRATSTVRVARFVSATANPVAVMQGTWAFTTSEPDLIASGVARAGSVDPEFVTTVVTIRDGSVRMASTSWAGDGSESITGAGRLTAVGGVITIAWGPAPTDRTQVTPHRTRTGTLRFRDVRSFAPDPQSKALDRAMFARRAWVPLQRRIEGRWRAVVPASGLPLGTASATTLILELRPGRWFLQRTGLPIASGSYRLVDDRVTFQWSADPTDTTTARIRPAPNGGISFSEVECGSGHDQASVDVLALSNERWRPL